MFETETFEGGLEESKRSFPDFLFIDYDTAKNSDLMRGIDNIPQQYLANHTRLIMLMDNPTRPRVRTAIEIGSHWVLSRPFSPQTLDRRIRAVLDPGSLIKLERTNERTKDSNDQDIATSTHLMSEMDSLLRKSQYFSEQPAMPSRKLPENPTSSESSSDKTEKEEGIILL
ncbi:MAG: hypothetical protein OIF54_10590 [Cohaesibacter sp.]|nr:hypothetical protein [Cohaesibacter sp.]